LIFIVINIYAKLINIAVGTMVYNLVAMVYL
jgi:hypothetical protein